MNTTPQVPAQCTPLHQTFPLHMPLGSTRQALESETQNHLSAGFPQAVDGGRSEETRQCLSCLGWCRTADSGQCRPAAGAQAGSIYASPMLSPLLLPSLPKSWSSGFCGMIYLALLPWLGYQQVGAPRGRAESTEFKGERSRLPAQHPQTS